MVNLELQFMFMRAAFANKKLEIQPVVINIYKDNIMCYTNC